MEVVMSQFEPMPTCPMAATCKGMMTKTYSGIWMMLPGLIFIVLGVLIILYPQILAWLIAMALIVMGIVMLLAVNFMRNIGKSLHSKVG